MGCQVPVAPAWHRPERSGDRTRGFDSHHLKIIHLDKKIERVMGIEPTYPAWKAGVLPLNYTRIFNCLQVGVTGFEPATSWSQTRRSSQAEPHPDMLFCRFVFVASPKRLRYNITLSHTCQHFFTFF